MRRREFLKNLLGGTAAAVVGAAVPAGLRSDEMALLEERVELEWRNGQLVVRNFRNESIDVYGAAFWDGEKPHGIHIQVHNVDTGGETIEFWLPPDGYALAR